MTGPFKPSYPSIFCTTYPTKGYGEPRAYPRGTRGTRRGHPGQGVKPIAGRYLSHTHSFSHSVQFGNDNQPTQRVFDKKTRKF